MEKIASDLGLVKGLTNMLAVEIQGLEQKTFFKKNNVLNSFFLFDLVHVNK